MKICTKSNIAIVSAILTAVILYYAKDSFDERNAVENTGNAIQVGQSALSSYSGSVSYPVPGSTEKIDVTLLVDSKGKVENFQINYSMKGSRKYQELFDKGKGEITGVKISELKLDAVAGATLTTNAFNGAVEMINSKISK